MFTLRRKILASCGQFIAAIALFFIIGGHWGVLQTVAWANMIWTYTTQDGSVLAGAKKNLRWLPSLLDVSLDQRSQAAGKEGP